MTPGCECPICNDDWRSPLAPLPGDRAPYGQRDFMDFRDIAMTLKINVSHVAHKKRSDPNWVPSVRVGASNVYHRLDFIAWMRANYDCINGKRVKR